MNRIVIHLVFLALTSCQEAVKTAKIISDSQRETVIIADEGVYQSLDKDAVSVFLPENFKRYSINQYQQEIEKIEETIQDPFVEMFTNMRDNVKGNFYLFYDKDAYSFCAVNSIPYFDFGKQDAKYMLGMIRKNQQEATGPDLFFDKVAANFSATKDVKIFKSIFKLSNFDETRLNYRHIYILSTRNNQTFQFIFNTPFEADFDPFIRRMKI